jgi:citryl-CoA lyase
MGDAGHDAAPAYWTSTVSRVESDRVLVRGYDLEDVIDGQSFTASCFLLLRGRLPTPDEVRALDAVLNAVLDYALEKPGTVAARYTVSANPSMVAGMAAAVLAVGRYTLAPEDTARFILDAHARMVASGLSPEEMAATLVAEAQQRRERIPGFGHPRFRRIDPRAQRLREVAEATGLWREKAALYDHVHRAFTALPGKVDIPINDVGMMAVVLVELGFTPEETTGLAVLSTMPGVVAHISEELRTGRPIRVVPEEQVDHPDRSDLDFTADRRSAGWPDGS